MKPNAKELQWFRLANAGHPPGFYPFKDRFLKRFAVFEGYCLQEIERECWKCEGSGDYFDRDCWKCGGSGIYRTDTNWLECWNLGGSTYHRPIDPLPHWQRESAPMKETIYGRIRHTFTKPHPLSPLWPDIEYEIDQKTARRAFYRLLLRFEPVNFYHQVCADVKARALHHRAVLAWRLMRLRDKLDLFPAVKEAHDDVPF